MAAITLLTDRAAVASSNELLRKVERPLLGCRPNGPLTKSSSGQSARAPLSPRHAAVHAERLGFVGCREDHATADGYRLPAQARVQQQLDRGVEGVQVRMKDGGRRLHEVPTLRIVFLVCSLTLRESTSRRCKGAGQAVYRTGRPNSIFIYSSRSAARRPLPAGCYRPKSSQGPPRSSRAPAGRW
jgi:hypothetical protein